VPYSVADKTAEHCCDAVCAVVDLETEGLLGGRVPHGHEKYETGVDGCFDGAEEETVGCYATERDACWSCDEDYAPGNGGQGEEFPNWETLKEIS
jgi:hypothetical protein